MQQHSPKAIQVLNEIMQYELAGVVRYTHYAVMVTGPNRGPMVEFMKAQAVEALTHAQAAGEILTGLDGRPTFRIEPFDTGHCDSLRSMIETQALALYKELLSVVADNSVSLEEYARGMIGQEELHTMELKKMLRGFPED